MSIGQPYTSTTYSEGLQPRLLLPFPDSHESVAVMASSRKDENLLQQWFPGTTTPFIANAPMFGFADSRLATAVTNAGGLGKTALSERPKLFLSHSLIGHRFYWRGL